MNIYILYLCISYMYYILLDITHMYVIYYSMKYYENMNGSGKHQIKDNNSFCKWEYEKEKRLSSYL